MHNLFDASAILESIADSFFVLDRDGCFVFATPKAGEVLGRHAADLIGLTLAEACPELKDSDLHRQVERSLRDRAPRCFEYFQPVLNRWFEHQTFIQSGGGISVYGRDITARRHL